MVLVMPKFAFFDNVFGNSQEIGRFLEKQPFLISHVHFIYFLKT